MAKKTTEQAANALEEIMAGLERRRYQGLRDADAVQYGDMQGHWLCGYLNTEYQIRLHEQGARHVARQVASRRLHD